MRIALTHNLRTSDAESQAEFDTEETIQRLVTSMERFEHRVEAIDVTGSLPRFVARLDSFDPDLIFNTAEGEYGRFREAFYPSLFENLGFPYTGSDAHVLSITLNKHVTKLIAREHNVSTPESIFVCRGNEYDASKLRFPVIVKPNFEGSSKGITQDSVVETFDRLHEVVSHALTTYSDGVLIEELISGRDLTVPFLEGAQELGNGVLSPCTYVIDPARARERRYAIYDYELKTRDSDAVSVRAPADISPEATRAVCDSASRLIRALGCRDLGRIDFRLSDTDSLYFLEFNALPSLESDASLFASAALLGLGFDQVIGSVLRSATRRLQSTTAGRTVAGRREGPNR